ncbi:MAG: MFS transporter [Cyanobacteriota bacterium]|nr:MFS transporter [Cyanobacteriota bacterium]
MRTFTILWFGQLISAIGSTMTYFGSVIWMWSLSETATTLSLGGFFGIATSLVVTLFSGIIVDRVNRKLLILIADLVAGLSTIALLILALTNHLQIWHLYTAIAINTPFNQIQILAYQASISLLVPPQHYTRATSMGAALNYGSSILAPALAGSLYPVIGLVGILLIDILTFVVAIATLLFVPIPQPESSESNNLSQQTIWKQITFGFSYIWPKSGLLALLTITTLFGFAHDIGAAIYEPMILARSGGNGNILGFAASAAGAGGITGAIIVSIWGGTKRRINGVLVAMMGAGISKTIFGLGQTAFVWIPAQFCSSMNFPLMGSSDTSIWLTQVAPDIQGRILAMRSLMRQSVSAVAYLIAGPLADYIFEPAMQPGGVLSPIFSPLFGTEKGAGIALLYTISSVGLLLVGFWGFQFKRLKTVENPVS